MMEENLTPKQFTEKLNSNLSGEEKLALESAVKVYRQKGAVSAKDRYVSEKGELDVELIFKTFIFTERLSSSSSLHERAFTLLKGEELKCYMDKFITEWKEELMISSYSLDGPGVHYISVAIPIGISTLLKNEDFTINYLEPFLTYPAGNAKERDHLIKLLLEIRQYQHFSKEEVKVFIEVYKQHKIDVNPILPSVKYVYDLENLPDDWVKEIYFS